MTRQTPAGAGAVQLVDQRGNWSKVAAPMADRGARHG